MLLEELQQAPKRCAGIKQVEKAIRRGTAVKVLVADDADERITAGLVYLCKEANVEVAKVCCMYDLGKACGIHVNAAAAAILKA